MIKIIATAAIYLLTMLLAYVLKKMGLFHKEDKRVLSNLIFYVTLPASLISGFSGAQVNIYYVVSILIGFGVNTVMVIAGQLAAAHKERDMQAIYAVNASGFNMACIAIPFLSNFYPAGVPYLCMFDVGDSFYTLGTTYAIAKMRISQKNKEQNTSEIKLNKSDIGVLEIVKSLFTSVPFDVYFIMTVLSFLNYRLPDIVIQAADFCGHGNGFLAMMMIGGASSVAIKIWNWNNISNIDILCITCTACYETDIGSGSILVKCSSIHNIFRKAGSFD